MQQASQRSNQPRYITATAAAAAAAVTYEEKGKAMNFDAEADSDSESDATEWERRKFAAALALAASTDGRQRSRIVTHPVVKTTIAMSMPPTTAAVGSVDSTVQRNRPPSPSANSSHLTEASFRWSAQSAVARKAAAASQRGGFQQQQQRDTGWRPKSMDFDAEIDSSDSDSEWLLATSTPRYNYDQEDNRQRSRVTTRPVVVGATTASVYHSTVRTRPASPSSLNNSLRDSPQSQSEQSATVTSQWTTQSAVARKAVNSKRKNKKLKKQQKQPSAKQLSASDASYRPRSSSESSFGRLFFGWRRPAGYSKQEAVAAAGAANWEPPAGQPQPPLQQETAQYKGKNVHNFSYVDAKIYSPQSQYQQQQQPQQQTKQQQGAKDGRTKTWSTMEKMGAVNSVYSNQILLAREVPTGSSAGFPV